MKVSSAAICALALAPSVTAASVRALKGEKENKKDAYYSKKGGKTSSSQTAAQRAATCEFQAGIMHSYMTSTPFAEQVMYTTGVNGDDFTQLLTGRMSIGEITEHIAEASDARDNEKLIEDGKSGDTEWPHGDLKVLGTVGEVDMCSGEMLVGVPDGMGTMLVDDATIRVIVQSESYGPLRYESYPFPVNDGAATFTGSHVQYADFDREMMTDFMDGSWPASKALINFGELITGAVNLNGELVGPRSTSGPTTYGAHFSNTDVEGNYIIANGPPKMADWLMQSLCSAHMEEKHQWGEGIGLEDDIFVTNEEWMTYESGTENIVGISAHAVDVNSGMAWAVGAFTNSGFEKIVEFSCGHTDYVCFSISGYNGAFGDYDGREQKYLQDGLRPDGKNYTHTRDIVPTRVYIGKKGYMEDGSKADKHDFLARNGLRHGQVYGFATDMSAEGPAGGLWRDAFHASADHAFNGAKVDGVFAKVNWKWGGVANDFINDAAWEFQNSPVGYEDTDTHFWTAAGPDAKGYKTEHNAPDLRPDSNGFVQTSTAGYFGHYYLNGLPALLDSLSGNELPEEIDGTYYVYQGTLPVNDRIHLGGKGLYAEGLGDATMNYKSGNFYDTFRAIDGFETILTEDGKMHVVIQEDSGNNAGERMFISSALEHAADDVELDYYFIAFSGGSANTRMKAGVSVPAGTSGGASSHEFSGVVDLSGLLAKDEDGEFMVKKSDTGAAKHHAEMHVPMNDKYIMVGLQAHNLNSGVIGTFQSDRGGQWLVYQPHIEW